MVLSLPLAFFGSMFVLGLTPIGGLLNIVFTPAAAAIALLFIYQRPTAYLAFTMWVWMLTPLYRRMADFQTSYNETSLVLLAPLVVTLLCCLPILRNLRSGRHVAIAGLWGLLAVILYGFFSGAVQNGLFAALLGALNWALPILFAIHIMLCPEDAQEKGRQLMLSLVWGGGVLGLYGVYQYFLLPVWDAAWMRDSNLLSIGSPLPRMVRVFGTLNSPGPYAQFVSAAVLVALATRSKIRTPSLLLSVLGLMLSLVRAAWASTFIGFVALLYWSDVRQKTRFAVAGAGALVVLTPLLAFSPLGDTIGDRASTISDYSSDYSYLERLDLYQRFTATAFNSLAGVGIGGVGVVSARLSGQDMDVVDATTTIDSGVLEIFYTFGLSGAMFLGLLVILYVRAWPDKNDRFAVASMTVALSCAPLLFAGNPLIGASGMLVYPFLAIARLLKSHIKTPPDQTSHSPTGPLA
ncbi:MAG: hypothetical protein K5799_07585 [Erythrobacter sp.]|nr:hypothetical protein [Erythrobacter sp.]